VPTGVGGAASRIPGMRLMRVAEGAGGDTEIAAPLLRVAVRASTALAFAAAPPGRAGDTATGVVPPSVAHRRSNVIGLW
jgi:hypothetical protein